MLSTVAGLEAMRGHFDDANSAYARAKELFGGARPPHRACRSDAGRGASRAPRGRPGGREREARLGLEILASVGNAGCPGTAARGGTAGSRPCWTTHGPALAVIDPARTPQHVPWQVTWRSAAARIEARSGQNATGLAHEAVTLAMSTDDPNLAGEALAALAETLASPTSTARQRRRWSRRAPRSCARATSSRRRSVGSWAGGPPARPSNGWAAGSCSPVIRAEERPSAFTRHGTREGPTESTAPPRRLQQGTRGGRRTGCRRGSRLAVGETRTFSVNLSVEIVKTNPGWVGSYVHPPSSND